MPQQANFENVVSVAPLEREQIAQAFPLVRAVTPDLTFDQWAQIAGSLTIPDSYHRRGILAASVASGHLYGLFLYRVEPVQKPKHLVAHYLAAFGVGHCAPVPLAMVGAVDSLACQLDCEGVQSSVAAGQRGVLACLEAAGHRSHRIEFFKDFVKPANSSGLGPNTDLTWLERWRLDVEALGPASEE